MPHVGGIQSVPGLKQDVRGHLEIEQEETCEAAPNKHKMLVKTMCLPDNQICLKTNPLATSISSSPPPTKLPFPIYIILCTKSEATPALSTQTNS